MTRGQVADVGTERWSQNGYLTVKTEEGWRYKHHIIAEEKLGRPLEPTERVIFYDGNRKNFDSTNIIVEVSHRRRNRVFLLEAKVDKMMTELEDVKRELESLKEIESS